MQTLWNVHPTCSGSSVEEGAVQTFCVIRALSCLLGADRTQMQAWNKVYSLLKRNSEINKIYNKGCTASAP